MVKTPFDQFEWLAVTVNGDLHAFVQRYAQQAMHVPQWLAFPVHESGWIVLNRNYFSHGFLSF